MSIGVKMTGAPWHPEILTKKEDDPKRHKRRCKYYKVENNGCGIYGSMCHGSAHCAYYSELEKEDLRSRVINKNTGKKNLKKIGEDDCFYYK